MLSNLLSTTKPTITYSEWKYVLTSNHLLLPLFLAAGGIDEVINDHTNLYLQMVVDVNPTNGRHQFDSVQHLISYITSRYGWSRLFKGGTAQQAKMIGNLISTLFQYCCSKLIPSSSSSGSILLPIASRLISSLISYPFETISLTHMRSKYINQHKSTNLLNNNNKKNKRNSLNNTSTTTKISTYINNALNKISKTFEEMELLKNKKGVLGGLYRGFFSGFALESLVQLLSNFVVGNAFDWLLMKGSSSNKLSTTNSFTKTIICFAFSHLITAPFTFARMRYQSDAIQNDYSNFRDCVNRIFRKEGWRALYRCTFIYLYIF